MPSSPSALARLRSVAATAALLAGAAVGVANPGSRPLVLTTLALLGLIALHEAGHLLAAKRAGVEVPEFAVGFGPRLCSTRPLRGTVYSLRLIPYGGFVRITGLGGETDRPPADGLRSFDDVSRLRRIWILAAGPFANVAVTFVCLLVVFASVGVPKATSTVDVVSGSPAAAAGVRDGDRIVAAGGRPVASVADLAAVLASVDAGEAVSVVVERGGDRVRLSVTPAEVDGQLRVGVVARTVTQRLPASRSMLLAGETTGRLAWMTTGGLASIASSVSDVPARLVSVGEESSELDENRPLSPIGASQLAEESARRDGMRGPLMMLAAVSMFVAMFNLLPVPPLDGGGIAVLVFEAVASRVRRRDVVVDRERLVPLTVAVMGLFMLLGASTLLLDIVRPVAP